MSKARDIADLDFNNPDIDGGTIDGATIDSRNVGTDGTKLDTIETNADVTDTTNVTASGALMDSELTSIASVKALNQGVSTGDSPTFADLTVTGEVTATQFTGVLNGATVFPAKAGEALTKGDVVYISGVSGNTPVVNKADANDANKMPAFGLAAATTTLNASLNVVSYGQLNNLDTSSFNLGDTLYVSDTPGVLTATPPTGEGSLVQNLAKVERDHASAGSLFIAGSGRANATPNLNEGNIFIGNASNQAVTTNSPTFVGIDVTSTTTDSLDLKAIAQSKSDTAVDVFVYDTSKDSDGGAWRNRTQNTSWYNEALNTATRGATKKFPSVAVIVAESDTVTIYDGDDPAMPMWMVFNSSGANGAAMLGRSTEATTCVAMLNGQLAVGRSTFGLHEVFFIDDRGFFREAGNVHAYVKAIVDRNGTNAWGPNLSPVGDLVHDLVNDISMTVLPNAPIDADTGLPVPTIAVATAGGISIIHSNGSVSDITSSYSPTNRSSFVGFNGEEFLADMGTGADRSWMHTWASIPTVDTVVTVNNRTVSSGIAPTTWYDFSTIYNADLYYLSNGETQFTAVDVIKNQGPVLCTYNGMSIIDENLTAPANGMVAYTASDYNTGWMNGDIKLATLSDTDTTNVTGSELITNNSSFSNTTGWYLDAANTSSGTIATIAASSSNLVFTHSNTNNSWDGFGTSGTFVVGQTYTIDTTVVSSTNINVLRISDSPSQHDADIVTTINTAGAHSYTFKATATTMYFHWNGYYTTTAITLSKFSVRLAEDDRSVNGKGLQVFGTVTKTAVATGADLVGYNGFSSSDFMVQPYNSDLDFGTGDFSIMGWINVGSNVSSYASILSRVLSANTETNAWSLRIDSSGNNYYLYTNNLSVFTSPLTRSTWQFLTVARRSGVVYFYVNGAFRTTGPMANTITNVGASVVVGYESTHHIGNSSVALWRISATAPTAEQIAKMYNDEKYLFQENAQATLYGTSDAVTALAYDDDTELLHAGTSAGRSVFQGLRRVSNTTDAVGAAISASNDLVVEE